MFQALGRFVSRYWWMFLGVWLVVLAALWWAAPPWQEVAQDLEFAFLPADVPSRKSEALLAKAFPDQRVVSNIVVIVERGNEQQGPPDREKKFIEDVLEPGLREVVARHGGFAYEAAAREEEPLFSSDAAPKTPKQPASESIISQIHTPSAPG